ncbi:hypothetical protein LTR28_007331 [Elasticomyces elasticus]|nr:hypothetical protein LTR28_007331 [Elasticomyces elasticus]
MTDKQGESSSDGPDPPTFSPPKLFRVPLPVTKLSTGTKQTEQDVRSLAAKGLDEHATYRRRSEADYQHLLPNAASKDQRGMASDLEWAEAEVGVSVRKVVEKNAVR